MNRDAIKMAIVNLEVGLHKYQNIMAQLHTRNVSEDKEFQRNYNGFFRMQRRTPEFYAAYFLLLEQLKTEPADFSQILKTIHFQTNRVEASFSSKMLSVIDPTCPVWDRYVLQNLGLKAPYASANNRIEKVVAVYDKITDWYRDFMSTEEAAEMIRMFDEKYPDAHISDVKKIDLILWQMR